jgi:phosphate transport system protein
MTRQFESEIERLRRKILHLTAMVEESLQLAVQSVIDRDNTFADEVIVNDQNIDQYEVEVEEECLKILTLHQPVAADLRYVVAVLKINNDLERIADLAVNIVKRNRQVSRQSVANVPFDLPEMLKKTLQMVSGAADALVNRDVEKAIEVCKTDNEVDELHRSAFEEIQKCLAENTDLIDYYLSLLSVSRNLERIADHATNIAEDVIYMVDGEIVRHQGG